MKIEKALSKQAMIDFTAGSFGGIACVYTGQPLDTVKVKMQTHSATYKNTFNCILQTFRKSGIRGFYAGATPAVFANIAENSILFLSYGQCQNVVCYLVGRKREDLNAFHGACAGSLASVFSTFALCPPELIKCRLQTAREEHGASKHITPVALIKQTVRQEGVLGLYRGLTALLIQTIPASFFFFGGYEGTKLLLIRSEEEKLNPPAWKLMLSGGVGGVSFWISVYPTDVIKSRVQVYNQGKSQIPMYTMIKYMLKTEGISSFYRGLGPTLVRAFPANAALFFTYEWSRKVLWDVSS
ncbi:mitochondrial ornithine transporter 1-like [Hydractinia symbiolongicarpus]|uniref:mitochondrial ornithine transporter 1-like n=1 Tax=Hydractinia symbiolongicarpus TaxID=13093 RepID=UPI002551A513|nr:mitochondrial ornithine transporter 1-like [Hydractinia symbiolongicarpus]